MTHIKWFDVNAESVPHPDGGFVNYPAQICIDLNPKFAHQLTAQDHVILAQDATFAAQAETIRELREALAELLEATNWTDAMVLRAPKRAAARVLKETEPK